jgi:hypothetical protein
MKKKMNISRAVTVSTLTGLAPFLLVWIAWVMTALSFNVQDIFQSGGFWFISSIYWMIWFCMIGVVIDHITD